MKVLAASLAQEVILQLLKERPGRLSHQLISAREATGSTVITLPHGAECFPRHPPPRNPAVSLAASASARDQVWRGGPGWRLLLG